MTQLKKNFIWNSGGLTAYFVSQWIITVMVTRFYGYTDAGILSLAMSIAATFQAVASFGIRNYQVSDIYNKYQSSCYVMLRIITCLIAMLLCVIFSLINSYSLYQTEAIFLVMVFKLAECFSDVVHGIAQKNDRLDIAGKGYMLKALIILPVFLLCYLGGGSLNLCLILMAVSSWGSTILFDVLITWKLFPFNIFHNLKECISLGKETFSLCIYLFLSAAVTTVPKYLLELMTDEETLGAYSSIFAPALIINAAMGYIFTPFVGKFAELYGQKKFRHFLKMAAKIMLALIIMGVMVLIAAKLFGNFALDLIFGETILAYASYLIPVLFAAITMAAASFAYMLEVVIRDFKNLIIGCIIGVTCSSFFTAMMINLIGADGTSVGIIIGESLSVIYMAVSLVCNFKRRSKDQTVRVT